MVLRLLYIRLSVPFVIVTLCFTCEVARVYAFSELLFLVNQSCKWVHADGAIHYLVAFAHARHVLRFRARVLRFNAIGIHLLRVVDFLFRSSLRRPSRDCLLLLGIVLILSDFSLEVPRILVTGERRVVPTHYLV
jgi:hypothetical protein